jgi:hypothetical protein
MKKITLVFLFGFINFTGWSQSSNYRYHELQDLGPTIEWAISIECTHHFSPLQVMEVNLKQNFKLEVGKIYKANLGLNYGNFGTRYYKVTYAHDSGVDMGDEIDNPPNFGEPIIDLCNSLSWKYVRPILLGSTLQQAQNNFSSNLTANSIREKVNIKTTKPLEVGSVYLMDFGKGPNYYLIDGSDVEKGDADYDLDPTNNNSVFSLVETNFPKRDYAATAITTNYNTSVKPGVSKTANFSIKSIGGPSFSSSHCYFYISRYPNKNYGFTFLKDIVISPLKTNEITNGSVDLAIPANITTGFYYIIMELDNDSNLNNNIISTTSPILVDDGKSIPSPGGTPDLYIDPTITAIFSECTDCQSTLSELGSKRHRINNQAGILNLQQIAVKNLGNGSTTPTNIQYYLSSNSTLETTDLKADGNGTTINTISPGGTLFVSRAIRLSDFTTKPNDYLGNWNILMVVDNDKKNTELNENNNITVIPVTFFKPPGTSKLEMKKLEVEELTNHYSINVYNFQGQKVLTKEVNNKEEENKLLESLQSGFYIVKSNDKTNKIYIK